MKHLYLLIICALSLNTQAQVLNQELLQHLDMDNIEDVLTEFGLPVDFLPLQYEVDFYKINYMTLHPNGDSVMVSGALCLPSGVTCPLPLSSYQHGTMAKKTDAPSHMVGEGDLGILYASVGYAIVLADYIGLGDSEDFHLYVHAESEANACLDLIRAAYELQGELNYSLNDQLFLWGYSQGGHATAALQRKIEVEYPNDFSITASAPMSGPYDISGAQAQVITSDEVYPTPGYLPYVVLSYQEVYGTLYEDLEDVFLPEYAAIIPDLFDGTHSMSEINAAFPDVPNQVLLPEVLEDFENDPMHPIRIALADNDVLNWAPEAPTNIYYCEADDQVSYLNSEVAYDAYTANGSTTVQIFNGGDYDHGGCAPLAMLAGFNFFQSLVEPSFSPDVTLEITAASSAGATDGSVIVAVDDPGNWTYEWSNGSTDLNLENLGPGFFILTVTDENGCEATFNASVGVATHVSEMAANVIRIFPVPATNMLNIETDNLHTVVLMDLSGRAISTHQLKENIGQLNVANLETGIYYLKFDNGAVARFLKE
jgi:pimeloyl-ACP methyl ester carboxylesterase